MPPHVEYTHSAGTWTLLLIKGRKKKNRAAEHGATVQGCCKSFPPVIIQHGWQTGLSEPMRIKEVKAQAVAASKRAKQKVISNLIVTALRTSLTSIYATPLLHRVHWWFSGAGQVGWDSVEDVNPPACLQLRSEGKFRGVARGGLLFEILTITCSRRFRVKSSMSQEGALFSAHVHTSKGSQRFPLPSHCQAIASCKI